MFRPVNWSKTLTFFDDAWHEGNVPIMGPRTHAAWLGTSVFDGARAFEGVTPDLDLHCARINQSAHGDVSQARGEHGRLDGAGPRRPQALRARRRALYPADVLGRGGRARRRAAGSGIDPPVPSIYDAPMPKPAATAITLSPFRRPTRECAPLDAKAGCLYPNNARALIEARARGFDNCLLCDMLGNIAELGTANIFMVKDGVVFTPAAERHLSCRHYPACG